MIRTPMGWAKWLLLTLALLVIIDKSLIHYQWYIFKVGTRKFSPHMNRGIDFPVVYVIGDSEIETAEVGLRKSIEAYWPVIRATHVTPASYLIPHGQEARVNQILARKQPKWKAHVEVLEQRADGTQYLHVSATVGSLQQASWYVASKDKVSFKYMYWFNPMFTSLLSLALTFMVAILLLVIRCIHVALWRRRHTSA